MRGLVNVHYGHALAHLKWHGKCEAAAVIIVCELDDIQEYFLGIGDSNNVRQFRNQ